MTITLNPELDRLVQERLATGMYQSIDHVLSAALKALHDDEQTIAAIAEGNEEYEAGRYESWERSDADFRKNHRIPDAK